MGREWGTNGEGIVGITEVNRKRHCVGVWGMGGGGCVAGKQKSDHAFLFLLKALDAEFGIYKKHAEICRIIIEMEVTTSSYEGFRFLYTFPFV